MPKVKGVKNDRKCIVVDLDYMEWGCVFLYL